MPDGAGGDRFRDAEMARGPARGT